MSSVVDSSNADVLKLGHDILAKGMSMVCHSLCCICFDTQTFINFDTTSDLSVATQGTLEELRVPFETLVEKTSNSADHDAAKAFLDLDTLQDRLRDVPVITLTCRTVDGKWSSAQFVVTDREGDGSAKRALYFSEAVSVKKQEDIAGVIARRQAFIDPLCGVLNRAGYEQIVASMRDSGKPMGFAIVDVDRFKEINDAYGHNVGDETIARVAEELRAIVRKGDEVARIGGDEFAMVLTGCPIDAWKKIVAKIKTLHVNLSEALPDGGPVTLSAGVCFSPLGLSDEMFEYADRAMYEIKQGGRGGVALADENGEVFEKWFDRGVGRQHDIALSSTVGSWRIEAPADGSPRRMFCDESMLRIAGEKHRTSPEELYLRWRKGLMKDYAADIDDALERLSEKGESAHTSFTWESETGTIIPIVTSVARDRSYGKGKCYYGFFELARDGMRRRESEVELLNEALARSLSFGYVLDLESSTYSTLRRPASGPLSSIKPEGPLVSLMNAFRRFIADDEGKEALKGLLDRKSLPSRLAGSDHIYCEFLSTGVQGWCRAKLYTLKAGGLEGLERVVLVGESIEIEKPVEVPPSIALPKKSADGPTDRVLIVDDEELNRVILDEALAEDYEVIQASNGLEAYEIIKENPESFSGVVTDLSMPVMDGFELLEKLQADGISKDVPVIVVTAEESIDSEVNCLGLGAIDFVRKPFHEPVAHRRVSNVVDLFKWQNHLREEVDKRTVELSESNKMLEERSKWLREYMLRLSETSSHMIEALGEVVEFRSVETGSHVLRVKEYTRAIAERLLENDPESGLNAQVIGYIVDASPLHDVGKIAIPDVILLKPGRLTDAEFERMKTHTTRGYDLLASIDNSWQDGYRTMCEEICLCHHERYDGRGYPNGLKGEEIPISAQIVSIADAFDALASNRVYRPALSRSDARDMIIQGKCGAFSDRILKAFQDSFSTLNEIADRIDSGSR